MAERCAVVGVGQTKLSKCRDDVSLAGMCREAAIRALEDAEMTWKDVEAVVIGTAPDIFEGVMMPEVYLADALGRQGVPVANAVQVVPATVRGIPAARAVDAGSSHFAYGP